MSPPGCIISTRIGCNYAFSGSGNKNGIGAKIGKAASCVVIVGRSHADHRVIAGGIDQKFLAVITGGSNHSNVLAQRILNRVCSAGELCEISKLMLMTLAPWSTA